MIIATDTNDDSAFHWIKFITSSINECNESNCCHHLLIFIPSLLVGGRATSTRKHKYHIDSWFAQRNHVSIFIFMPLNNDFRRHTEYGSIHLSIQVILLTSRRDLVHRYASVGRSVTLLFISSFVHINIHLPPRSTRKSRPPRRRIELSRQSFYPFRPRPQSPWLTWLLTRILDCLTQIPVAGI